LIWPNSRPVCQAEWPSPRSTAHLAVRALQLGLPIGPVCLEFVPVGHCYQRFTHGTSAHQPTDEMCPLVTCNHTFSPSRALVQPSVHFLFRSFRSICFRSVGDRPKSVPGKPPGSRSVIGRSRCSRSRCPDIEAELPTDRSAVATRECIIEPVEVPSLLGRSNWVGR
jgi:hypothetical protein